MKPAVHHPLWWAACLVSVATGIRMGSQRPSTANVVIEAVQARPGMEVSMPDDPRSHTRQPADQFDSESLLTALLTPSASRDELTKALIDREGWKAWPKVLAIADTALREELSGTFLKFYAERDPKQAFAEWKKHRSEFSAEDWGNSALIEVAGAAARTSADSLIEFMADTRTESDHSGISTDFAEDFDFARMMDYLASSKSSTQVGILNLLPAWAERSPLQAAMWLEAHRDFAMDSERILNLNSTMVQVVAAELPPAEREQAVSALGNLPEPLVDQMWNSIFHDGDKPDASLLESATLMKRREDYLRAMLLAARQQGRLDPAWDLVPAVERIEIFKAVDSTWNAGSSPVETESKERWRKMITSAWGIDP